MIEKMILLIFYRTANDRKNESAYLIHKGNDSFLGEGKTDFILLMKYT